MDINFKQGMKCVGNSLPALKPGGTVIAFMQAERGADDIKVPEDSKPLWLVKTILRTIGPSRVMGFLEKVKKGLTVEEKFLMYYSMQLMRQYDLYFHVPTLNDEEIKKFGSSSTRAHPADRGHCDQEDRQTRARGRLPRGWSDISDRPRVRRA